MPELYGITLTPGATLQIHGTVPEEADRSSFNLQYGPYKNDEPAEGDTIALHFDIRHGTDSVVKNHFEVDGWGEEEVTDFPSLNPGDSFLLEIKVTAESYSVQINGVGVGAFQHRVPLEEVTHLFVFHDVTVNSVSLNGQQLTPVH
ncbi:32 kDa beta-galactoside-binding lectin lec-3 [Pseudolycoriella hygida]|uniref:Galectin n=1 Tax=Pseudolycoriella hygida TaxID=35572 RepID=A0A9Q0N1I8_9DIPT|nr:32 kDa beta-galactoside-binding lectin lec-3 [Pseudolycoriella hygida]